MKRFLGSGSWVRGIRISLAFSLCVFATGCSSNGSSAPKSANAPAVKPNSDAGKINTWMAQQPLDLPPIDYRIAPPDKVRIVAPGIKEINGQETVVRPDGTIALNLVGNVKVAGLTPAEISEVVAQKLDKYYKAETIDVSVQITEFKSQHFYVFGQVAVPGIKPFTGRDTILKALAEAQINEKAWPQRIVIVRPNDDVNIHQRVTVDLKDMYENGKVKQNFLIEAGDVVYVPLSPVAEVSQAVMKVVTPIVPATQLGMMALGY